MTPPAPSHLVDLSHTIEHGMATYRGLPAPLVCDFLSHEASRGQYAEGTTFHIGKLEMVANTGTYIDVPFHRYPTGEDLAEAPLDWMVDLPGRVVRVPVSNGRAIGPEWFAGRDVQGHAVLVHTGWDRHWRTDAYFEGHPFLTEDAAEVLRQGAAALVGIDALNIDDTDDGRRPVHTLLLGHRIPIVEHLTRLDALPEHGFRFFAAPFKVRGLGSLPVRAFARLEGRETRGTPTEFF